MAWGAFRGGVVRSPPRSTGELRGAGGEGWRGLPAVDEQARIRAVYDYVVSRTRYVALEFGIHSFKPYPVETVLTRRFGDCKDKASLMHAMVERLGIDSQLELLLPSTMGDLTAAPAALDVVEHDILYVAKCD